MEAPESSTPAPSPDAPARTPPILWLIRLLAGGAAAVAGYLAVTSFLLKGLPLGCGSGSGCDEVLQSKWSALFGIPIGFFALAAYVAVLAASFSVRRGTLLLMLAVAVTTSALWFVVLQLFVLKAICIWCMADHALGLAMACASFVFVRGLSRDESSRPRSPTFRNAAIGGVALATTLIVMQVFWGASGAELGRLPENENADTGPGPERRIGVFNGQLQVAVHNVPVLGSPDAESLVVILYDYCCPHCRKTHEYLVEGLERYDNQYGIVLLPMPLDEDCNRSVLEGETEPRFEEACHLARLALAVWRADPAAFPAYDGWLYEPEMPRSAVDARAEAEAAVGTDALEAALADLWIEERISADVEAYIGSDAAQIPIVLSPGMDAVVGRAESAEELFEILERELGLSVSSE